MYAACGPPKKNGKPKRWVLPTATSAPNSPGDFNRVKASKSATTVTRALRSLAALISGSISRSWPSWAGYAKTTPYRSPSGSPSEKSVITNGMSSICARPRTTEITCGRQRESMAKKPFFTLRLARCIITTASATAVASSSREALAISRPVSSMTVFWKFSRASRRPCEISA